MKKDFDDWNKEKKQVDTKEVSYDFFYYPRELWWCAIGLNVGIEMNGKHHNFERPVLVLKKFNKDQFWGIPLTSNEKTGKFYYKIKHDNGVSWAVLSQVRVFSTKRLLRKIGRIPEDEFKGIQIKLRGFI